MEEIEDIIIAILKPYRNHFPADIIDQVFLAFEADPYLLKRYHEFADGDYATTNKMIGKKVEELTGLKTVHPGTPSKSKLIKTFSLLGH